MWNLFKKESKKTLVSPVDGKVIPLAQVEDEAFSSGSIGTGYAVKFEGNQVVAPINGEVATCFPTGHAIGIKADASDVIIHIGIDTVNMHGEGFHVAVKEGDIVKKGDLLVKVDSKFIQEKGYDPVTMVLLTNGNTVSLSAENCIVKAGDEVAEYME